MSNEKQYLFIDGGCLRVSVKALSEEITGDRETLSILFPKFAGEASKVFYYDAVSAQEYNEAIADYEDRVEQEYERFDRIRAQDRFHVALGEIKGKRNRRQKQVDVRLAVDMLTHTFRGNMNSAILFAGDDDFIPLIEALVREGMDVTIWHPPQASESLLAAADNRRPFDLKNAHMLVTRDNNSPAFYISSSGGDSGNTIILEHVSQYAWTDGPYRYLSRWKDQSLQIWRSEDNYQWAFYKLEAPKSPLSDALVVFSGAVGWKISDEAKVGFIQELADA